MAHAKVVKLKGAIERFWIQTPVPTKGACWKDSNCSTKKWWHRN